MTEKDLEKEITDLKEIVKRLGERMNGHSHLGYDQSTKLSGNVILKSQNNFGIGNSFWGYGLANQGEKAERMLQMFSVGRSDKLGTGRGTLNTQLTLENQTEPYTWQADWVTSTAYAFGDAVRSQGYAWRCYVPHTSGASTEPFSGADYADNWQLLNYYSFYYGLRMPAFVNNEGVSVTSGGSTLQDTGRVFGVNELTDSYISAFGGGVNQTLQIASNTEDTVTVDGTWDATATVTYTIFRPVFLGGANFPWKRLYVGEDIRFGYGSTAGDKTFRIIKVSDSAMAFDSVAFGSVTQNQMLGSTFGFNALTGTMTLQANAAVTSTAVTAIHDGDFDGQLLFLIGTDDTNTITILDGANTALAGDVTLGENDTITLIFITDTWVELSRSNN